ncbi:hypothetical protein bcere0023_9540 [Bacillus cereus Rock4-2]|nr:hypothetical protein bcere0023_9540 [Bacillus cereus Rock4-2]
MLPESKNDKKRPQEETSSHGQIFVYYKYTYPEKIDIVK